jgi:hypothetical protein
MRSKLFYLIVIFILLSCEKEELPVEAPTPGEGIKTTVSMQPNYQDQIFFSLQNNNLVSSNKKTDWDLAFSVTSEYVRLNSSKFMSVMQIEDLKLKTDTIGFYFNKRFDKNTGKISDFAINRKELNSNNYIVDLGFDENGKHLGFRKMKIKYLNNSYVIEHSNLDNSNNKSEILPLQIDNNYTYFSFDNSIVNIEPFKNSWDLLFTQYVHFFYEPSFTPYLVTGVLLNPYNTLAIKIQDKNYDEIDFDFAQSLIFDSNLDVIGYDWKTFTGSDFKIELNNSYIIKNNKGFYYKLRFLDFYDNEGNKGSPNFEYQLL